MNYLFGGMFTTEPTSMFLMKRVLISINVLHVARFRILYENVYVRILQQIMSFHRFALVYIDFTDSKWERFLSLE